MTALIDKEGQPLRMDTHLSRVNMDLTTPETLERDRFLAAWDATKPNLGTMDQAMPSFRMVPDPDMLPKQETALPVSNEMWLERWDATKPDLGTFQLPDNSL